MKKYLTVVVSILIISVSINYLYFYDGRLYIPHDDNINTISYIENNKFIVKKENNKLDKINIKGVNLGLGIPGYFANERAISKETYLRWFKYIKNMGANTIRVYTLQGDEFYEAIYEYNNNNKNNPIYIMHGVQVDEKIHLKNIDAYDKEFKNNIKKEAISVVNAIHGRFKSLNVEESGKQKYKYDISKWVIGYIFGVEWEPQLIAYTNKMNECKEQYKGKYIYTENASAFEIFLAEFVDEVIVYESKKYGEHRNFAISNWSQTDPFDYDDKTAVLNNKYIKLDVENIKTTSEFKSNNFASYHIYPYYPEYELGGNNENNSYKKYIKKLNDYHKIPVVISEFGVPTSRGRSSYENNRKLKRDEGQMTEIEQGKAIVSLYKDIMDSGSAGGIVFTWQDEWYRKSWNTVVNIDLLNTAYWNDYQTELQNFGLLSFDPGEKRSVSYPDGNKHEWKKDDIVSENKKYNLSAKYDEKYMYFLIDLKGENPKNKKIYIPIDTTQKTGSKNIKKFNIETNRFSDFVISIDGKNNSNFLVQDRYDSFMMTYIKYNNHFKNILDNPPEKNSSNFVVEKMILQESDYYYKDKKISDTEYYKNMNNIFYKRQSQFDYTGNLKYGNGNPKSKNYNNLSDFCYGKDFVEIRIPWQMLNFYNPSKMEIHDDYYEKYGVEPIKIKEMYLGVGEPNSKINLKKLELKSWNKKVTYHERLKKSYYILKDYWKKEGI